MHQNLWISEIIPTSTYLVHLFKMFLPFKLLTKIYIEPFSTAKANEAGLLQAVIGHIGSHTLNNMRFSFGKKFVMKNGGKIQMVWITYILTRSGLIFLILQPSKYPLWFLYLVAFSNKKKKGEYKLSSVQPQKHSIVGSLKSTWTVNYGHATIIFSVLQTMTSSYRLTVSFYRKLKHTTKCFCFCTMLSLYSWKSKQCNKGWCIKHL